MGTGRAEAVRQFAVRRLGNTFRTSSTDRRSVSTSDNNPLLRRHVRHVMRITHSSLPGIEQESGPSLPVGWRPESGAQMRHQGQNLGGDAPISRIANEDRRSLRFRADIHNAQFP